MVEYIETKSILSKLRYVDSFFGIRYNMNLYRGCQHACIYCDTRSNCYGIGNISNIRIKKNAIELLKKELNSKKNKKGTVGTGSMNDPYMPLEKKEKLTLKALEMLSEKKFPVHVITKGDLVMRDVDILKDISKIYAAVSFSIPSSSDVLAKKIELHAPPTSVRFKAMEYLAKNGIYTGVTLMPILPFINDTKQNIEEIVMRAKDSGASYILPMFGVTLRSGSREFLYKAFDTQFKGMKEKYDSFFGNNYECFSPQYHSLKATFIELINKTGLKFQMDFYSSNENEQLTLF